MPRKNILKINTYKQIISRLYDSKNRNKLIFGLLFLLLILVSFLSFHNTSSKVNIESNSNNINLNNSDNGSINDDISSLNTVKPKNDLINDNRGIPVLYYHSVQVPADNEVTISPDMLRTELKYIKDEGYTTLTMRELEAYILNNSPIPNKSIVITFDDGYMNNYNNAFPILKDLNMVATIFCITTQLDGSYYLSKDAIVEMSNYGIDIESHTVNHPKLDEMTYNKQLVELADSKKTLEAITGKKVDSIAYPFGNFNNNSLKAAKAAGYTLGFTTNRGLSDRDDNPLSLDRIYVSSKYNMDTFKEILNNTKK